MAYLQLRTIRLAEWWWTLFVFRSPFGGKSDKDWIDAPVFSVKQQFVLHILSILFSFSCLQAGGNYKVVLMNRRMEMKLLPKEIWGVRLTINQAEVSQWRPAAPPVTWSLLPVWSRGVGGWWMSPSHRPPPRLPPYLPPGCPFIRLPPFLWPRPLIVTVSLSLSLASFFLLGNR